MKRVLIIVVSIVMVVAVVVAILVTAGVLRLKHTAKQEKVVEVISEEYQNEVTIEPTVEVVPEETPRVKVGDLVITVTTAPIVETPVPEPTQVVVVGQNEEVDTSVNIDPTASNTYVDTTSGDIDDTVTVSKADKVFIDNVSLLTNDFPINRVDFILTDISKPLIKIYGNTDSVYALTDYVHSVKKTTFTLRAEDDKKYGVTITYKKDDFTVKVEVK